jgi:hypothetical protein
MEQITLSATPSLARPLCAGKLAFVWGCYGYAIASLWHLAGANPWGQAAAWIAAAAGGLLMLGLGAF